MRTEAKPGPEQLDLLIRSSGELPNAGDWVLVATLASNHSGVHAHAVRACDHDKTMQRYESAEQATVSAYQHSAMRVGGGWALNLRTGETVRVKPMR
jgi:hypothetical protein